MAQEVKKEIKYTKEQLLHSKRYSKKRDLLGALLADDKTYSLQDVDKLIKGYFEKEV